VANTGMSLPHTVLVVVGTGLVAMAAAVLVLRTQITTPAEEQPATSDAAAPTEAPAANGSQAARELHPVAVAIVDREVARNAQRRAVLG
jgi:Na+-transporting methylmalonyl-CoA/oxaloacetate decarboxylase gamma subunit